MGSNLCCILFAPTVGKVGWRGVDGEGQGGIDGEARPLIDKP